MYDSNLKRVTPAQSQRDDSLDETPKNKLALKQMHSFKLQSAKNLAGFLEVFSDNKSE